MLVALLDLDSFVYAVGFAGQHKERAVFCNGEFIANLEAGQRIKAFCNEKGLDQSELTIKETITPELLSHVLHSAKLMVNSVLTYINPDKYVAFLTGKGNFRETIYPEYKANRIDCPKPLLYQEIRDYYAKHFNAIVVDGIEADDAVIIEAEKMRLRGNECVICSIDKDLRQYPGLHYNPNKPEDGVFVVDEYDANFNFYCQLLTGDRVDNIPGIDGIGPKKAVRLIGECSTEQEMYNVCDSIYKNREIMHRNAKLLYMLRSLKDEWQPPFTA